MSCCLDIWGGKTEIILLRSQAREEGFPLIPQFAPCVLDSHSEHKLPPDPSLQSMTPRHGYFCCSINIPLAAALSMAL